MRGAAAHGEGRYDAAERAFSTLAALQPGVAGHWLNLGTALRGLARYDEALCAFAKAHAFGGVTADFCFNVGLTHLDRFDYEAARAVLGQGVALAPRDAEMRLQFAKACFETGRTEEGTVALSGWQEWQGLQPALVAEIGRRLQGAGASDEAAAAMGALAAKDDLAPEAALELVHLLERANRLDDARQALARVQAKLSLWPVARSPSLAARSEAAAGLLAQRAGRHPEAIGHYERALALDTQPHRRYYSQFPLARSLAAVGRADDAWDMLGAAHRSQVAQLRLAVPLTVARGAPAFAITRRGAQRQDVAAWSHAGAPAAGASPIFIVAFPRSGTTLLEQVLDAHPALCSMDEQPFLHQALEDLVHASGGRYPEALAAIPDRELDAIRARYFERVRSKVALAPGQRIVDKNPLNLLRLAAIRRLFPHARILLAVRHPCDVLLSCYMQQFTAPEFALLCADLPTLAAGYRRAFDGWYREQAVLAATVREVRYETLVGDFEAEVHRIATFLGLPWDDALLAPAAHARAKPYISTPSYAQVVQPVTAQAVGRWRAYRRQFAPVLPILAPCFERWGYDAG
ncbi:MAG: sulfotransferase [Steroidobacteraceae bacterium]